MMKGICLILTVMLLASGMNAWARDGGVGDGQFVKSTLNSGGVKRNYMIYFPKNYLKTIPVPLLIALHGRFGTGKGMMRFSGFIPIADKEGFIVVYPDGYKRSWHDSRDYGPAADAGIDDVAFISALIDTLSARYAVDLHKVYVAGMSNGGFMALTLACSLPGKIAAVASVTGCMAPDPESWCNPRQALAILLMPGTQDPLVPFEGGEISNGSKTISFREAADFWLEHNHCLSAPIVTVLPDAVEDGTMVRKTTYLGCEHEAEVALYEIIGGGHTWPGGKQYLPEKRIGRVCKDIRAEEVIADFLLKHKLK